MEYVIWYASSPAFGYLSCPPGQLSKCSLFRCFGSSDHSRYPGRAGPDAPGVSDPNTTLFGCSGTILCHTCHVAGIGGQRLRGRAEEVVGLRFGPVDEQAPLTTLMTLTKYDGSCRPLTP